MRIVSARCLSLVLIGLAVGASPNLAETVVDAAEASYREGSKALRTRDYAVAAAAFARAAELKPDELDTWLKLGIARAGLKEWNGSIEAYRRAIEIDPRSAKAHHNLANVHFRRGAYEEAAEAYGRALEIDPDYLLAAFHHGWTLRQLNRAEEAEAAFIRCLKIPAEGDRENKTRADCVFGLGSIRHRAGDYAASAQAMEQVVRVHPGHLEARYYLGMAYRQLGRLEEAREQLEIHAQMLRTQRVPVPIEKPID